jgi:hypothetical protein
VATHAVLRIISPPAAARERAENRPVQRELQAVKLANGVKLAQIRDNFLSALQGFCAFIAQCAQLQKQI